MATKAEVIDDDIDDNSSADSDSSSTSEEERLRELFNSCDGDGDGYLDGTDFMYMCKRLNMEDAAQEIMENLGMITPDSRITFLDFLRCRTQVMAENYQDETGIDSDTKPSTNLTSWPTMSSDSLGAHSCKPDSLDYDSGARDLSPEPSNLQHLRDSTEMITPEKIKDELDTSNYLELANKLHLAALTSLKGDIIDLTQRLQHNNLEREGLEKQLNKSQTEKLRVQRDFEDKLEQTTSRYEERITELHSVIAELRKKIERHQINVIKEEEEDDDGDVAAQSTKSNDGGSINQAGSVNNADVSQAASNELSYDLNSELSRVVTELENTIDEKKRGVSVSVQAVEENADYGDGDIAEADSSVEEKALQACKQKEIFEFDASPPLPPRGLRPATFHPPPPPPPNEFPEPAYLQEEITSLKTDNSMLQEQIAKQEADLNIHRAAIGSIREERDMYKRKLAEIQSKAQLQESSSPQHSRTSTPTKSQYTGSGGTTGGADRANTQNDFPVAKVAELKKLKTCSSDRQVHGAEISSTGLPTTKVAEHLVHSLQECSNMQEIVQALYKCGNENSETKVKEFEIQFELLQSKIDNLKSQNDMLNVTLEESKALTDRLSVLIGKYESNSTALQMAMNYSDQAMEIYDVLYMLVELEVCDLREKLQGNETGVIYSRPHHNRQVTENVAKHLLNKLDKNFGHSLNPWEEHPGRAGLPVGSTSGTGLTKADERRLREYIQLLKSERSSVKQTIMELESVHIDQDRIDPNKNDAQRIDLENAVLMQELMAIKEEKAELRAQNYLLEKEKRSLELRLSGKESQERAYLVQIDHLKSEVKEQLQDTENKTEEDGDVSTPAITLAELRSHDSSSDNAQDLSEALKREKKLKARVQELVVTLEKLSRNSEIRHQQSADFINDLKRANSALISAFDKAKKKYQSKLKRMEMQIQIITDRYESQVDMLKQRLMGEEPQKSRPAPNETSL